MDDTAAFVVARIGSSAGEVGAIGLAIERFGWAVRIGCICDNQSFIDCSFTDNVDGALIVRDDADILEGATWDPGAAVVPVELAVVSVLTLVGCHMGGAS